jgi:choline dehydrogenase-like flavoprotein
MTGQYEVIIVGTGFAGAFFLKRYLEHAPASARVLVLERGRRDTKAWQLEHRRTSSLRPDEVFVNLTPEKDWLTSPGFGGNSKEWLAGTIRMMPGDFQLKTRYGVGVDWPLTYDDLESYYCDAEAIMAVSGPENSPMPRSRPFPLPPHRFADPDRLLAARFPDGWFVAATARASRETPTRRACCASGICQLCPVDAKFTIQNGLAYIYDDPRVTLQLEAAVDTVEVAGGRATGVTYRHAGRVVEAKADLVVLGASALFNPHILLRSKIDHPLLGCRLHEQMPIDVCLNLRGVSGYNGSTVVTGIGYLFYEGEHRRDYAACIVETRNSPFGFTDAPLRVERGRWTERAYLRFMFDDIPRDDNQVRISASRPELAEVEFRGYSDYAERGRAQIPRMLDTLAEALPIESVEDVYLGSTSAHIQGTVAMGSDKATSIVDRGLVHHDLRNLLVLGASAFPTASPAYPTLTVSALSLWAADRLFGGVA